ncbi:MAG: penicillin-insensitive murein endopeptidase [Rhodobacteraceae bacterium]|nr:penicillin-insensitive murein endopeptidase [Paracoccaceae bacterium]
MNASTGTLAVLAAVFTIGSASAEERANQLFGALKTASDQPPAAIGSYARGCASGLVELPETGPTWQAMRLSRNRNWGHPVIIDYLRKLSLAAVEAGWAGLYIGDISQPRGGPMTSGHRSHQIGLDADIWMLPPDRLDLTRQEREDLSSISVRTRDQTAVNENWSDAHMRILKSAAKDPRTDRIFVAAAVKINMCENAGGDRQWLQRIRPLYGHNYHFHIRLKCPQDSPECITQSPTVAELSKGGDGCDETLAWWVTDYLEQLKNPPKEPAQPRRGVRDYVMADLPASCEAVLNSG